MRPSWDLVVVRRHIGYSRWLEQAPEGPSGPSMERSGLGFVANHFDVVPVRTNDKSCIVVRVVVRAQTRRTVVFATRRQSRAMERFDLLAILGRERQMKMRRLLLGLI